MIIKTNWHSFDAILRSEYGENLASGEASISVARQFVTFESDFVPLYPIGTPMEIVRLHQGEEIHRFTGKVYLSDKKLMRIVSVKDELLPGSERFYNENMDINAVLTSMAPIEEGKKKIRFRKQPEIEPESIKSHAVKITALSEDRLIFRFEAAENLDLFSQTQEDKDFWDIMSTTTTEVKTGEHFLIKIEAPLSLETEIEVSKPFYFGQYASYACQFINLPKKSSKEISSFLWEYNIQNNKLF
ncbi:hypothetical protein [Scatolibacter rhodanostii]|uniref:hypothetical protein n=1 Tax=Scatolibacter rhodanostii TaxID=2014781 RepID=UPI000C07F030|nr:hypothetical protein [Scatolibacter rhodanostii]